MEKITLDTIKSWTVEQLKQHMRESGVARQVNEILRTREAAVWVSKMLQEGDSYQPVAQEVTPSLDPSVAIPPTIEELAAQAEADAAVEAARQAGAQPIPVDTTTYAAAEDAQLKAVGIVVFRDTTGNISRLVQDYQVTDEDGTTPIGRSTHLEARTLVELILKQRQCHENATRAFHRMKKQKLTRQEEPVQSKVVLTEEEIIAAAQASLKEKDVDSAVAVVKQIVDRKYDEREQSAKDKEDFARGRMVSAEFMQKHIHDYNPCKANSIVVQEYMLENKLAWTVDNLEIAFADLTELGKLAPVPHRKSADEPVVEPTNPAPTTVETATPAPAANPAPATAPLVSAQVPAVEAPSTASQHVERPTETMPATPQSATVARRPGVNAGIQPGTFSAQRPTATTPTLTKKDIARMKPEELRLKLKDPKFVVLLEGLGIKAK